VLWEMVVYFDHPFLHGSSNGEALFTFFGMFNDREMRRNRVVGRAGLLRVGPFPAVLSSRQVMIIGDI
jgi:hypothetical protein